MGIEKQIVVRFAPQSWEEVDRFQKFFVRQQKLGGHDYETVAGVANHFYKAINLLTVANAIAPKLEEDERELKERGYTSGQRAAEFSAVVESALTALYSSVDCTRKVLNILYPNAQGLPDSTRKLFQNAADGKVGETVPKAVRDALVNAPWFVPLRIVRDTLTHTNTGTCSRNRETGAVQYFNNALKPICDGKTYIEDFIGFVTSLVHQVNEFMGRMFHELNHHLVDTETWQMCGIFYGRVYHRFVRPADAVDFNSGRCGAYDWFDKPEHPTCPFASTCGAYVRSMAEVRGRLFEILCWRSARR